MGECRFGNIILPKSGKNGILTPDDEGYYTLNGGGFNIPNRQGVTYSFNSYIQECMSPESDFRRRLERGEVQGEMGHPPRYYLKLVDGQVVRHEITTVYEWILRLRTIDQDRVCMLISDVLFSWEGNDPKTSPLNVKYRLKPFGPFGKYLEEHLKTPSANTSISIRTVISPTSPMDKYRNVEYWTGADWVPEPGMDKANKWMTEGCEGLDLNNYVVGSQNIDDDTIVIDSRTALQELEKAINQVNALQLHGGCEGFDGACEVYDRLKRKANESHVIKTVSAMSLF